LREFYAPEVAKAERERNAEQRESLLSQWSFERDTVVDPVYARKAERLTATARGYGITVPSHPSSYQTESDDWEFSNTCGEWLLSRELEDRLRREIKSERRAKYDEFRKWTTLLFALLGFALGLASVLVRQKTPDPCPSNYYRSDTGECIFALPRHSAQPETIPHAAAPINRQGSTKPQH
jgi:hypothetical protein